MQGPGIVLMVTRSRELPESTSATWRSFSAIGKGAAFAVAKLTNPHVIVLAYVDWCDEASIIGLREIAPTATIVVLWRRHRQREGRRLIDAGADYCGMGGARFFSILNEGVSLSRSRRGEERDAVLMIH